MAEKRARKRNDPAISTALIKEAAIRLFAAKGYANASLEEIADVAKFTKGAVYYYFKSKERLLLQILDDIEERSITKTAGVVDNCAGSTMDRLVQFNFAQARWAAAFPDDLAILMLTSIESANKKGRVGKRVAMIYEHLRDILDGILNRARAEGEIERSVSTEEFVLVIMAIHDGNMLLWYRSGLKPKVGRMLTTAAAQTILHRYNELRAASSAAIR